MKYMGEESRFDFESEIGGICVVEQNSGNSGNSGNIKTYTINLNCSNEDETIIFYGSNGKIIYVIAFYL
jgi:hypothetical protein